MDTPAAFWTLSRRFHQDTMMFVKNSELWGQEPIVSSATRKALRHVQAGDIIFGIAAGGQEKLLIVHEVDDDDFWARHILSQTRINFGRDGESRWAEGGGSCTIVSTAKLPPEMYAVALGLDRKFAARLEYPDSTLTKDEIALVLNHDKFFRTHVLPGKEAIVRRAEKINGVRAILHLEWDPISARDNPPDWNAYLGVLSELVDLLEIPASTAEVRDFLDGMAANAERTHQVGDRSDAVASSLVQSRESWS